MPDITNKKLMERKRLRPFYPIATEKGCLYCPHRDREHKGKAIGVRREGKKNRRFVLHAIFCEACASEKGAAQVACWQMPERVYRNFSMYGVELGSG